MIPVGRARYFLTHDLGTTADKACIFDDKLNLIASEVMDYKTYYPKDGKAVQRPEDWWSVFCRTTENILGKRGIDPHEIAAVACSGHSPSMVPLSADGESILEAVPIYADLSSREEVSKFMESVPEEEFYSMTGAGQVPEQYSLFKMMAFKRENHEGFDRTWKILNTVDYLVYRLTGNVRTDFSQACNTGALD
ncbi:MAG TPA: pentose kinase, partial [Mesotoga infera]|nr:pentose kinase [Mesotoga infera]